jgi:CPA2 family monovalent cation:H+ antiporter-2
MHHLDLILTLTSGLAAALFLGYITQRLKLSPIVGYLLAGVLVGPATPGFVADRDIAEQLASVGVILLMFGVGLHFDFGDLLAVRRVAVPGAIGQSLIATLLGCVVGWSFGWSLGGGLVYGVAISVASTVVLLRVLADHNDLHSRSGHIAVGWLVVEDLFTVLVLVLMPVLFQAQGTGPWPIAQAVGFAVVKIGLMGTFIIFGGGYLIPFLLKHVAATRSRELFTLTILVIALGIAVGAARLFGVSMELGAFLAGMVVGRSDFSSRAAAEALPMRDAFAVLFFVSVGMMFDPQALWTAPGLAAVTLAIIMIGKPLAAFAIVIVLGYPLRIALSVAIALSQIGEFSFILATMGAKVLPPEANNALVASAIVSISLNPILYRLADPVEARLRNLPGLGRWLVAFSKRKLVSPDRHAVAVEGANLAIVVGYGPVGKTLVRLLKENEIVPVVIDLNLETVQQLRLQGARAVYGDAAHRETLHEAGVEDSVAVFLTSAGMQSSAQAIRRIRDMNPQARIFVRTNYLKEADELRRIGADAIFASEGEVALSMTELLLRQLGASAEQIDRERDRVRNDLFGGPQEVTPLVSSQESRDKSQETAAKPGADLSGS